MPKSNLRKVVAKRANLLENLFESVFTDVVDGEGETINMGVTYKLPTFEMYATHALENLSAPDLDHCKSLPFFYFLTFEKADCSIFARLVGRLVGRRHH